MTKDNKLLKVKTYFLIISLTVFILSLTQTALTYNDFDGQKTHSSFALLLMGGLAILGGGTLEWLTWLANPIYFSALILFYKSDKKSIKLSILATIIALSFISWKEILAAESGRTAAIERLNAGYWLWTFSQIILSIGTIYYFTQLNNKNINENKH